MGNVFDGIERPLKMLQQASGDFIERGIDLIGIDLEKKWHFIPTATCGDNVNLNSIIGNVNETELIVNKIMCPLEIERSDNRNKTRRRIYS